MSDLHLVTDIIPRHTVDSVFNPLGDGNCGFRAIAFAVYGAEDEYEYVKKEMREQFIAMQDKDYVGYLKARIEKVLSEASGEWFISPECSQIAADTFGRLIAVYGSNTYLFLPFQTHPAKAKSMHPIVLQLIGSHFILVKIKEDAPFQWPEVDPFRVGVMKRNGRDDPWESLFSSSFEYSRGPHQALPIPKGGLNVIACNISDDDRMLK
ncbi:hypothetical protein BX666DRAFT_2090648 [Dichotomocladium elegans]|nr:hypothetical protein BX666DRAFT_2090648 [Dichotomocladium elegans]